MYSFKYINLTRGIDCECLDIFFLVRGRVIVVDSQLKPLALKLDKIVIENPKGLRMRQWNDMELVEGK